MRFSAATALPVVVALCGCHVGPDYQRPAMRVPPAWEQAPPGALAAWPAPDWWTAFGSPQLDALMAQARAGNTDVAAAAARVRQADAQARVAGAPLLPSLAAQTSVGPERLLNNTGRERHYTTVGGVLQACYEIDFWGKNQATLEAAQAGATASRYQQEVVWLTTSTSVANTYFAILALQDRIRIARRSQAGARHDLDDLVAQERQGIVAHMSVVQQQAVVASVATAIPPLQGQSVQLRDALALLVGALPEQLASADGSLAALSPPAVLAGVPSELLSRRPDVQAAEAQLVAANANIRVARAQFFPSFSLTANGGLVSLALAHSLAGPLGTYQLLSSVTQPIFEGGALRGQLDSAKAAYQVLLLGTYRKSVLSAFGDVQTALAAVQAAADEQAAQQASLSLAQQSSGLSAGAFRGGTGTILAVLLSETSLYTIEDTLAQTRLARLQSLVGLFGALGGGWKA